MKIKNYVFILVLFLTLSACSDDKTTSFGSDQGADFNGPLASLGCDYSQIYACYRCEGGSFGEDYQVACRAENDCYVFCGSFPEEFTKCEYQGPGESEELCNQWPIPPRGTLDACHQEFNQELMVDIYTCPFCGSGVLNAGTSAKSAEGQCLYFTDSCIPEDWEIVPGGCEEVSDAGAGE